MLEITTKRCVLESLIKTVVFRLVSFASTLLLARIWFGDWHVSKFQIFLLFYCSAIYYVFEKMWAKPDWSNGE